MTDLQTLLAAAQRLDEVHGTSGEYGAYDPTKDIALLQSAMLDILRPLLPGRPVPMRIGDVGTEVVQVWAVGRWCDIREQWARNGRVYAYFEHAEAGRPDDALNCIGVSHYRTRAEADREAYWRRLDAVIRRAGELAQGERT